jgi:dTDP-4-amino-4,6-dideoxygalactose transaminase
MMEWRVPLADLDYGEEENRAVLDVLNRRWLTMGSVTQEFEKQFAHLACLALGIGPGDEVIVPSLTFVATANAVLYTGAQVRFADIMSSQELTISPGDIEAQIRPNTRAIIVMHYGGYPCRMEEIMAIAARHQIAVIEDAAHSPGASLMGKGLGTWGEVGCFSFFSNKNLSTGEGGMLVTQREDIAEKVRLLRSHGMTSLTWDRHQGHAYTYDVVELGYNYRIDEIRSALGLVQLNKLSHNNLRRRAITEQYWQAFVNMGIGLPFSTYGRQTDLLPAYHIFPILLPEKVNRLEFIQKLKGAGIQTSVHYPPIHQFSYYRQRYPGVSMPLTENVAAIEVTLPLYPTMGDSQVGQVIQAVQQMV